LGDTDQVSATRIGTIEHRYAYEANTGDRRLKLGQQGVFLVFCALIFHPCFL
jgi:hypothetical protein